ncbi:MULTISPECIES: hypothetical protein [Kordiimonas]|jgi:hypothetical protein|uniref:hypothetical protein n=1 Tax=Kordiimonas TaxID=288021 RepID=UPI00257A8611|nr:hypothetical protein [Kordiimonas sp. UBA4487]
MLKYLAGLVSGLLLVPLGLYLFLSPKAFWKSYGYMTDDIGLYSDGTSVGSSYNYALGENLSNDSGLFETDTLQLVEIAPVQTFAAGDIERVCLMPSWYGDDVFAQYNVQGFLTAETKARVAEKLAPDAGKQFSFRLKGTELSSFILSADLLKDFGDGKRPDTVESDFEFEVPEGATFTGLYYAHILSGGKDLEMCEPTDSADMIPHYQDFMDTITRASTEKQAAQNGEAGAD